MSNCGPNSGSINKTFIIEPLSLTGGSPTLTACTTMYTNLVQSCSGDTSITLGTGLVTISGNTQIYGNITANTIEAITYLSGGTNILDIINASDTFITGGTFSNFTDSIQLTRNDGANVIITGLTDFYTTGATLINDTVYFDRTDTLSAFTLDLSSIDINDTFVTGFTYDDSNNLTVTRNDGTSITTTINTMSGLTINGILNVTGDTTLASLSATTISGGTYYGDGSNLTGIDNFFTTASTLINNVIYYDRTDILSAFTVDLTSFIDDTNIYTTGTTLVNNIAYFDTNTTLSAYTLNLSGFVSDDIYVTGATFTGDTLTLFRNDDASMEVTGFSNSDVYTTGATKVGDDVYFDRNDQLSAYSFTLTGLSTTDFYVTGGTFSTNTLTLTRNDDVIISVTGFTDEDIFTTGGTLIGNIAYFDTNDTLSAYTVDLSTLSVSGTGNDFYTTGSTLIGNTIYFDRNDQLSAYTVDLSSITTSGGTSSGGTDTIRFHGSRAKANQANIFLRHDDGTPYNIIPYRVYTDGTITNVIASGRDVDTWDAHLLTGTTITTDSIYHLKVIVDTNEFDDTVALDVNSGTTIYLYMSGTSVAYPTIDVYIKKR